MSFTAEVKDELARVPPTCSHCEKATLAALVRIEGTLFFSGQGKYRIEIATDVPSVARLIIKLLHELYHLETNLTVRRSVLHKTPNYLIEAPSQPRLAPALVDMGVLSPDGGLELGLKPDLVEKQCCTAAYLRGAFLGSGFVSDPRGDFHFEITVESEDLAEGPVELLDRKGIAASSGSACTSGSLDPSHVLLAIGLPHEVAHGSLRLSVGEYNTDEEMAYIVDNVRQVVAYLRSISPVWDELETGARPHLI